MPELDEILALLEEKDYIPKLLYTQDQRNFPSGTRVCEICGKEGILEYMYAMGTSLQVTGHYSVPTFNCQSEPSSQHWGCCPEHVVLATIACLLHDEHLSAPLIKNAHAKAEADGLPAIAPEHRAWAAAHSDNFPYLGQASGSKSKYRERG